MKKVALIVFAIYLFSIVVFAHPGRTDENGGHWNRKTGEYHFHTGEYAWNGSSGNSSSSDDSNFVPPYDPPTNNPYLSETNEDEDQKTKDFLPVVVGAFIITAFSIFAVYILIREPEAGCLSFSILFLALQFIGPLFAMSAAVVVITVLSTVVLFIIICVLKSLYKKITNKLYLYETAVIEYEDFLSRKETLTTAPTIPQQYEIGDDNLPKEKGTEDWGKSLTFYKSLSGKKLHQKYNCGNATTKVHLFQYRNYRNFKEMLCKNCSVQNLPEMRWYNDFLKYQEALKGFDEISAKSKNTYNTMLDCRKKCNSIWFAFLLLFSKKKRATRNELNARCDTILNQH